MELGFIVFAFKPAFGCSVVFKVTLMGGSNRWVYNTQRGQWREALNKIRALRAGSAPFFACCIDWAVTLAFQRNISHLSLQSLLFAFRGIMLETWGISSGRRLLGCYCECMQFLAEFSSSLV